MRMTKKWVSVLIAGWLLTGGLTAVHAEGPLMRADQIPPIPDVVARVNGNDISSKHVKFEFARVLKNARGPMTAMQRDKIVRKIIDKEVVRELIYQEGLKLNMKADPKMVEEQLESLLSAYEDKAAFTKALGERGITIADLKKSIEVDSLAHLILEKQVKGQVEIDDATVKKYYEENREKFHRPKAYRANHILISPFPPDLIRKSKVEELRAKKEELTEKARKKIKEIQEELKNGADIAELAKKYSHDEVTAKNGGDLDFFYLDAVEKSFGDAVAKLKIGETSDIVETNSGFHLIKLVETKPSEHASLKEMEGSIQKHLFMEAAQDRVTDYLAGLRKKAKIKILY